MTAQPWWCASQPCHIHHLPMHACKHVTRQNEALMFLPFESTCARVASVKLCRGAFRLRAACRLSQLEASEILGAFADGAGCNAVGAVAAAVQGGQGVH